MAILKAFLFHAENAEVKKKRREVNTALRFLGSLCALCERKQIVLLIDHRAGGNKAPSLFAVGE